MSDNRSDETALSDAARENEYLRACLAGVLRGEETAIAEGHALLAVDVEAPGLAGGPRPGPPLTPKHLGRFTIFLFVLGLTSGGYFMVDGDFGMGLVLIFGMCVVPTLVLFVVPWAFPSLLKRFGNPAGGPWHGPVDRRKSQ